MAIDKELLDQLLAGRDPQALFARRWTLTGTSGGVFAAMTSYFLHPSHKREASHRALSFNPEVLKRIPIAPRMPLFETLNSSSPLRW